MTDHERREKQLKKRHEAYIENKTKKETNKYADLKLEQRIKQCAQKK
jgi:hypothetical protein